MTLVQRGPMTAASSYQSRDALRTLWATLLVVLATIGLLAAALAVHSSGAHHDHDSAVSATEVHAESTVAEATYSGAVVDNSCIDCMIECALAALGCALMLSVVVRALLGNRALTITRALRGAVSSSPAGPPLAISSPPSLLTLCISRT